MSVQRWLCKLSSLQRIVFRRRELDQELDDEIAYHVEAKTEENIAKGMTPEEARRAARIELGGVEQVKENVRSARTGALLETFLQDIRFGLRMLRKNTGFTTVAVLTLALGIGANTAIFSVVYGIAFRPLPYRDANRLVVVWVHRMEDANSRSPASLPDFRDWQRQNAVFEGLAAFGTNRYDVHGLEGGEGMRGALVTPGFFPLLGVKPFLGRELGPSDDRERVVVLSYDLWQRFYHGDRDAIGQTIRLSDDDYTVVGVMPPDFRNPPGVEMWLSFADVYALSGQAGVRNFISDRGVLGYNVLGRLKKAVSIGQAQNQMDTIERRLAESYPKDDKGLRIELVPLRTEIIGNVEGALLILLGAVGFVLLIACVNVTNLMLARATVRGREMAIRRALGATKARLFGQALTESGIMGILGGGSGLLVAFWTLDVSLRMIPRSIPRLEDVRLDAPVLLFTSAATLGVIVVLGLTAAVRAQRLELNDTLRSGGRGVGEHRNGRRLSGVLVSGEIALASMLVIGAGLMLDSFIHLMTVNPGFSPDHLLTFDVIASFTRYRNSQQQIQFFDQILARIRALPGVNSAGACTSMPPDISQETDTFRIQDITPANPEKNPEAWYLPATPGFVSALGLPVLRGRDFSQADTSTAPPVAIINQEIAKRYFRHRDPIGQEIEFSGVQRTIIGVVGNTTYSGLGAPPDFQIYIPYAQGTFPGLHFAVRTSGKALNHVTDIADAIRSVDGEAKPTRISTMEQLLSSSVVQPRFYTWLLVAFGVVAVALAAIGVFGLISYSVSQQTHDIGIRMALGAQRNDVLALILREGLKLVLIGIGIGIAGAVVMTRFLSSLLYDVAPTDPLTFAVVSVVLVLVGLVACYIPARRAMRVDPMVALRYE
jgi:putative ABC transport system permease protein